ncbi:ADP-dependent glucokinase/phosphofructokinase [Labrys monachus]|uniref:ADP-dependent phosphofructokinase/glucokinase n=1 Tax=Labrys monachus TaxID=217067 RepID=A0ABU0FK82_9HYPH|nr:ADP-dependent glucokinase/phosphofructokinase [Labrys monachus]MDQ0395022.1 ADP-dependent phosphofructokinase/glucokinase [Labrys monachus]
MHQEPAITWLRAYDELLAGLPGMLAGSRMTLCGMGACVDARISMHDMPALVQASDPGARAFADMLMDRARRGVGGEIRVDWRQGPAWLAAHVPMRHALGGTGPQAAWSIAAAGADALVALEDRSAHMLAQLPPDMLVVENGAVRQAGEASAHGTPRPDIFIFEYTAGMPIGGLVPTRSSRIIVRFDDLGLENDEGFYALTPDLARNAGAGLVSGFNALPADRLDDAAGRVFALSRRWRANGLHTVHLELAGYDTPQALAKVLDASSGAITSIGMSHSEFVALCGQAEDLSAAMCALGDRLGIDRVCVHADHWAMSATLGDPARERAALMTGCIFASARAAAGRPVLPAGVAPQALFAPLPYPQIDRRERWTLAACASPYLEQPATTLGLGDSFTGGCLLALGSRAASAGGASGRQEEHALHG